MAPKTIVLKGEVIYQSAIAHAALTPGHLVEFVASGAEAGQLRLAATAAGSVLPRVVVEEDYVGEAIGTAYASGDLTNYVVPTSGAELYMWLASGENVNKGAELECDGSGDLRALTGSFPLFEAAANTDASSARTRIKVTAK